MTAANTTPHGGTGRDRLDPAGAPPGAAGPDDFDPAGTPAPAEAAGAVLAAPDVLRIGERELGSRLLLGTGGFRSLGVLAAAIEASGTELVTVALRRVDPSQRGSIVDVLDRAGVALLPNTAGCFTARDAVLTARLAREAFETSWVKLEVIGDQNYLWPDPIGTLEAARRLVDEGFVVLPYTTDDPILAQRLEEAGCATIMPLASPIGSGQGIPFFGRIRVIVEQASVPVVVDAGLGVPSDAAIAMELGADACLVNTAIAQASDAPRMALAFAEGVRAGRDAFLAGRIPKRAYASATSPLEGVVR